MNEITLSTTIIEGEEWILLKHLDKVITVRADSIEHKGRIQEKRGHRVDECRCEGSVKCKPRCYRINF